MRGISILNFNKIQWKFKKLWRSKVCKKIGEIWKNTKNCCFCLVTFEKMKTYDNIKRIKKSAWCQTHAYQISSKNIENWQSYLGFKLWKEPFLLVISHLFSFLRFRRFFTISLLFFGAWWLLKPIFFNNFQFSITEL